MNDYTHTTHTQTHTHTHTQTHTHKTHTQKHTHTHTRTRTRTFTLMKRHRVMELLSRMDCRCNECNKFDEKTRNIVKPIFENGTYWLHRISKLITKKDNF